MKAIVDKSGCISCGVCINTCPEVYRFDGDGAAEAYAEVTAELEERATQARDDCPVSVITIED